MSEPQHPQVQTPFSLVPPSIPARLVRGKRSGKSTAVSPGIFLVILALLVVAGVLYLAYRFVFRLPSDQSNKDQSNKDRPKKDQPKKIEDAGARRDDEKDG